MNGEAMRKRIQGSDPVLRTGRVRMIMPTHIEADGPSVGLGALCRVEAQPSSRVESFGAEVVRVDRTSITLSPFEEGVPTFSGALVTACTADDRVPVGEAFLGRAVDALGSPIDGKGPIATRENFPLRGMPPSPLDRASPALVLETGIRAIDGLVTLGKGQRVGVFAASGVGKTSLMTQMARQVEADIAILCLVGERGREVEQLWNQGIDQTSRARATLVSATSDQSAAMRVRAANYALALAEYWREQGKHVLFLLDSATRLAMAMREMGLSAGEPPTVRAYTPNVFSAIPKMIERCGALKSGGAISAIVTVLSESDEVDDPVCELLKSLLDGHVVLSRTLAEQGHFPAIDVGRSVSRQAEALVDGVHRARALTVLESLSLYESARTLINTGLHAKGANPRLDSAIASHPAIVTYLRQGRDERASFAFAKAALARVIAEET